MAPITPFMLGPMAVSTSIINSTATTTTYPVLPFMMDPTAPIRISTRDPTATITMGPNIPFIIDPTATTPMSLIPTSTNSPTAITADSQQGPNTARRTGELPIWAYFVVYAGVLLVGLVQYYGAADYIWEHVIGKQWPIDGFGPTETQKRKWILTQFFVASILFVHLWVMWMMVKFSRYFTTGRVWASIVRYINAMIVAHRQQAPGLPAPPSQAPGPPAPPTTPTPAPASGPATQGPTPSSDVLPTYDEATKPTTAAEFSIFGMPEGTEMRRD